MAEYSALQVVQFAEDAELRELGDAGDEDEAQELVTIFQWGVKGTKSQAHLLKLLRLVHHAEQRCVVLVDEHHHPFIEFVVATFDEIFKPFTQLVAVAVNVILILKPFQLIANHLF